MLNKYQMILMRYKHFSIKTIKIKIIPRKLIKFLINWD